MRTSIKALLLLACHVAYLGMGAEITPPIESRHDSATLNLQSKAGVPISSQAGVPLGSDGRAPTPDQQNTAGLTVNPPTAGQFQSALTFGGEIATLNSSALDTGLSLAGNASTLNLPRSPQGGVPAIVFTRTRIGASYVSGKASFLFGSVVGMPEVDENGAALTGLDIGRYWFTEPYTTNNHADGGYYWSPHAKAVFSIQPGPLEITWKRSKALTTKPADYDANPGRYFVSGPNYFLLHKVRYYVSGSAVKTPRRMFWTESSFRNTGKPVQVPDGRVGTINVVYNKAFPERVAKEFAALGDSFIATTGRLEETRTLWYSSQSRQILAYNQEGRVFVELLGDLLDDGRTRKHLGFEIVDVSRAPSPADLRVDLGEALTAFGDGRDESNLTPEPVSTVESRGFFLQHFPTGSKRTVLYAKAETKNLNDLFVHWMQEGEQGLLWPFRYARYQLQWPVSIAKYEHYVRPVVTSETQAAETGVVLSPDQPALIEYEDPVSPRRAHITPDSKFYTFLTPDLPAHRTLLSFRSGTEIAFSRVFSWLDSNLRSTNFSRSVVTNLTAWNLGTSNLIWPSALEVPRTHSQTVQVGQRILPPAGEIGADGGSYLAGYIRESEGNSYNTNAYQNPFVVGFEAASKGTIIPVNAIPGKNLLEVWWYRLSKLDASKGFKPVYWPSVQARYTLQYPTDGPQIVLASNDGSGPLDSLRAKGRIYRQNDRSKPGFNPNEEHALMIGGQAYALRDDLNVVATGNDFSSKPYVLVEYTDSDDRISMSVFEVLREKPEAGLTFDYIVEAGNIVQAPMPLPLLPAPTYIDNKVVKNRNVEVDALLSERDRPVGAPTDELTGEFKSYDRFTIRDRKESFWVYRGVHAGNPTLEAGTYDVTDKKFVAAKDATAVVGERFQYRLHTSRRSESMVLTAKAGTTLPKWLTITGLDFTGTPVADDAGVVTVDYVLSDAGDEDASVSGQLKITVVATGTMVTQGVLTIEAPSGAGGGLRTFVGRPPYLAQVATGKNSFKMRYYYRRDPTFDTSSGAVPESVNILPYLRPIGSTANGTDETTASLEIVYRPVWPANPPLMDFAETLTVPLRGLPAVRGQTSAQVLYQQSIATAASGVDGTNAAVILHDPTREKVYFMGSVSSGLTNLPASVATSSYQGKTYFPKLPPHLAQRFFFDPNRGAFGALVLRGEFKDEIFGEKYLQLNVLGPSDISSLIALCSPTEEDASKKKVQPVWETAIKALSTTLETYELDSSVAEGRKLLSDKNVSFKVDELVVVQSDNSAVDSYALSAKGPGKGFVTMIVGNGTVFTPIAEPVSVYVIRVGKNLHTGELKVLPSANPLNELLTIQHTPDLAAGSDEYEYDWRIAPPVDGFPPEINTAMSGWSPLVSGQGIPRYTLGGAGIQVLVDNYITMRFRAKNPKHPLLDKWSEWTSPQLAEGWIKRVLAGINPFNQRITDLFNNSVNTDVSLVAQAGRRWEGDVALNLENINSFGLIEIYETVLRRGRSLSIDAGINFGPANDALLLVAGYLNDLYMMVGNEAFADASNPTIGIGTRDGELGDFATALFAFKGQMPSLLEEELGLLRGRDDFLQPGVEIAPVYNRLVWNYTRGIDSGEVVYALNYNIKEDSNKGADGVINAADAAALFPQGHGDAYGHYLTAVQGYYGLLSDADFDWVPRVEAVSVLGQPVTVDYLDERKFASAASSLARTGRQVTELTWRKDYTPDHSKGWKHLEATRTNDRRKVPSTRFWSVDHWATRTAQGAYLNWVFGNSMLPAVDPDPTHEGVQKIDRTTVPELSELVTTADELQTVLDSCESGSTPLGLSTQSVAFDLDPEEVVGSRTTHFEQVFDRARSALNNAVSAFDEAKDVTRLMRSETDSLDELRAEIASQELAYTNALIELYGTPYPDDVGPGRTYKTGYTGPDILHFGYIDDKQIDFGEVLKANELKEVSVDIQNYEDGYLLGSKEVFNFVKTADEDGYKGDAKLTVSISLAPDGFPRKPSSWSGRRSSPGALQQAISDVRKARTDLIRALDEADGAKQEFDGAYRLFKNMLTTRDDIRYWEGVKIGLEQAVATTALANDITDEIKDAIGEIEDKIFDAVLDGTPEEFIAGLAAGGDIFKPAKGAMKGAKATIKAALDMGDIFRHTFQMGFVYTSETASRFIDFDQIADLEWDQEKRGAVHEMELALNGLQGTFYDINVMLQDYNDKQEEYRRLLAQGERLQMEREVARRRTAALIQGYRTRDAAFRIFRNEKLERYKTLFDLSARYSFLAAQAYDYETGLLGTEKGRAVLQRIVSARALGIVKDGEPQYAGSNTGDSGLSSALAEMMTDWGVLKGRLGFNNPDEQATTVSLRTEKFRILPDSDSDLDWRDVLQRGRKANLMEDPDIRRHCMQIDRGGNAPVPGIVIEFSTTISDGFNLFGNPLAAGDHNFSPSSFANKIYSVGVVLDGYLGMDGPAANTAAVEAAGGESPAEPGITFLNNKALAATPYVYLIPVGVDSMRSPALGDANTVRTWSVEDVTIPLPFNIGGSDFSTKKLYQSADSLSEALFSVRKHQAFRPVANAEVFDDFTELFPSTYTNSRLIGRSVWNSKWKLVIPGHTLLSNPNEGLDRFINMVTDVKLHFSTYSYSGN